MRSIHVAAAISANKTLMFHVLNGRWNGDAASDMYRNRLGPALRNAYPTKRRFLVLEDNDPSGYKSSAGKCAKVASKVDTLDLPKRSPDLNTLDYGFWSEVNRRMRHQERGFSRVFRETRKQYIVRLRRTAMRMPKSFLAKLVQSMKRRCAALRAADGYDFEE